MRLQKLLVYFIVALLLGCSASSKNKSSFKKEETISSTVDSLSSKSKQTKRDSSSQKSSETIVREKVDTTITVAKDSSNDSFRLRDSVKIFTKDRYSLTIGVNNLGDIWYDLVLKEQKIPVILDKETIKRESMTTQGSVTTRDKEEVGLLKKDSAVTVEQVTTKIKTPETNWTIITIVVLLLIGTGIYFYLRRRA